MAQIRIDKFLADAGLGTRSQVKQILKKNRIMINDIVVKASDIKVDITKDKVAIDGKEIGYNQFEYYMLNKPAGVVSAVTDKKDKTVIELINTLKRRDLFPVGRLDKDTEGLLLITNDGQLSNNLLSPKKHIPKTYFAKVLGQATEKEVALFNEGLEIGEKKLTKPGILEIDNVYESVLEDNSRGFISEIYLTITEGKFHQVKRMFEAVGMEVIYLKRISMGILKLDETLELGQYRKLTEKEIEMLQS